MMVVVGMVKKKNVPSVCMALIYSVANQKIGSYLRNMQFKPQKDYPGREGNRDNGKGKNIYLVHET